MKKRFICWGAFLCILIGIVFYVPEELTVMGKESIYESVIRFHVLANSDSEQDQALKIKVKDEVVRLLEPILQDVDSKEMSEELIKECLSQIERTAEKVVRDAGYHYPVNGKMEVCYFPRKTYGDCTFPAGYYQALRICIGDAEGKNWWCVLYPKLCFTDSIHAVIPEEEKEMLKNVLTEEDYQELFQPDKDEYKICFFFQKLMNEVQKADPA